MAKNDRFRELLNDGIYRIKQLETKPISVIQDELGYAIGKKTGGSSIEHWRKGFIPGELSDLAALVKEIVRRTDLGTAWALDLLNAAQFPYAEQFCQELLDTSSSTADIDDEFMISYEFERSIAYRTLVGRQGMIETILRMLTEPAVYPIVGIDGIGGIGKTALVQEVMIQCQRKQLFEKIIWYSNRENRQSENQNALQAPLIFEALLTTIGTQLGVPNIAALNLQDKSAHVASFLRRNKTLVVLDNLETMAVPQEEMIRQLSPLLGKSRALLTSRQRFSGDLQVIHLLGLDEQMACQFLRQESAYRNIRALTSAAETELQQIVKATGGLPLAMKLVVGQLDLLPVEDVLTLLQQVHLSQTDNEADDYERFYHSVIAPSWHCLSRQGKVVLIALTFFAPGQGSTLAAVSQVSAIDRIEFDRCLAELWSFSFVERSEPIGAILQERRYFLHPLVQAFVQAVGIEPQFLNLLPYYHGCGERFVHYYMTYVTQHHMNYTFMDYEHANLLLALDVAMGRQLHQLFLTMVNHCCKYWEVRGLYSIAVDRLNQAQTQLQAENNQAGVADLFLKLGYLAEKQGQLQLGMEHVQAGLKIAEMLQDERLKSELLHIVGRLWLAWGDYSQAHQALIAGLDLARLQKNAINIAAFLASLGKAYQLQGEYQRAETLYQEGLQLSRSFHDLETTCLLWLNLGSLSAVQGDYEKAETYLTQGLQVERALGHQEQIAKFLHLLAGCAIMRGDLLRGEEFSLEGLAIAQNIGHLDLTCTILINLGVVAGTQNDLLKSEHYWQDALDIARMMNHPERIVGLLTNLTRLASQQKDYVQAEKYLAEAETIIARLDNAWAKNDMLIEYGRLKFKQGTLVEAAALLQNALIVARKLNVPEMDGDICWLLAQVNQALGHIEVAHTWGEACLQVYRAINHGDVGEVEEWLAKLDGCS